MKLLLTVCSLLLLSTAFAQVNFSTVPFSEALQKAKAEGKIIFLQFEAADCVQCNDVANKGLSHEEVSARLEQTFFCLKVEANHPDRNEIEAKYAISPKGFGSFFIDNSGTLLHSYHRTTSSYKEYLKQIDLALAKAGEVLNIGELEKEYKKGNRSYGFLQVFLEKKRSLRQPTDAVLEEYIASLPADSLNSMYILKFIAGMAPVLDTKADKVLRSNQGLFNRAWYSMSLPMRISINNVIIYRSMEQAIQQKDEKFALRTATFAQNTNTNFLAGAKAYDKNMLHYYDATGDSTNYFRKSIAYYERYLLTVSADSIKKRDTTNMKRMLQFAQKDTVREGNRLRITAKLPPYRPIAQSFSAELNNGAYQFFLRTSNPYLLSIATEWSKKSLDFFESPETLDTYAKLLYKQAQKEAAKEAMLKAITLQQKRGLPVKTYQDVLDKMNKGIVLAD